VFSVVRTCIYVHTGVEAFLTGLPATSIHDVTESMVTIRSPFCGYNLA